MFLVLGLGNPGGKYAKTRHNVGFVVLDRLAQRWGATFDQRQFKAEVAKARIHGQPAILAKPQTFMNLSGQSAAALRGYYKLQNEQIVVVHDEVDLPFGQLKIKTDGGHGGHNGLRNLKHLLGDGNFLRVRVGVSRPPPGWETADYVLGKWAPQEAAELGEVLDSACDAVEAVLSQGVLAAMNTFNQRRTDRSAGSTPGTPGDAS